MPVISAIVVNYRRPGLTLECLASLRTALDRVDGSAELVVVDNGSGDDSCRLIREAHPDALLLELPANLGFPAGLMEGIRRSSGEWILAVNNDVTLEPDAVRELLAAGGTGSEVGSVAAQMRFADDPSIINSAGIEIDRLGVAYDRLLGTPASSDGTEPVEVFGASAGTALYRRSMLDDVGGFDESFFFGLEDADLAWRARARRWRCLYAPGGVAHHRHAATGAHGSPWKYFLIGRNRVRMLAKNATRAQLARYWAAMLAYDLGYVAFVAVRERTLAPLRGRLRGLRQWRWYRRASRGPFAVELEPVGGVRAALRRRRVWVEHSAGAPPEGRAS